MKEATEKTPKGEYDITAKLHFLHRLANGYLAAKILRNRLFHNHRRFTLNDIMEQVVAMEGDYQAGELFTGDISQIMGIEEEINDVSVTGLNFEITSGKSTCVRTMCCLQIIWRENRKSQRRSWSAGVLHGKDVVQAGCD